MPKEHASWTSLIELCVCVAKVRHPCNEQPCQRRTHIFAGMRQLTFAHRMHLVEIRGLCSHVLQRHKHVCAHHTLSDTQRHVKLHIAAHSLVCTHAHSHTRFHAFIVLVSYTFDRYHAHSQKHTNTFGVHKYTHWCAHMCNVTHTQTVSRIAAGATWISVARSVAVESCEKIRRAVGTCARISANHIERRTHTTTSMYFCDVHLNTFHGASRFHNYL